MAVQKATQIAMMVVVAVVLVGCVLLIAACNGFPVSINERVPVDARAQEELPIEITRGVDVRAEHSLPVRMDDAVPVALTGPITVSIQLPSVTYDGVYISEAVMERVNPGETTEDWVLAVLGEPTARTQLRDGSEIWRWDYRPQSTGTSFLNVMGDDEKPTPLPVTAFGRIRDGVVVEKFRSE